MIAELATGWHSLKAAKDVLQGLNAFENAAAVNEVKVTLQGHILEAQESLFAAQELQATSAKRIADLEAQIMRMKDWSSERERYELVAVSSGAFFYMEKAGMRSGQPAHWLCPSCFEGGKKSIMQRQGKQGDLERPWTCSTCKLSVTVRYSVKPEFTETE